MKGKCAFLGVSRAAYYAWVSQLGEKNPDQERMEQVQTAYETSHKTYGYRRITIYLQQKMRICINHKVFLRLMGKLGIRSQARKPKMHKKVEAVYMPFARQILEALSHLPLVLVMDGSQAGRGCMVLMVGMLYQKRALPIAWLVYKGKKDMLQQNAIFKRWQR